MPTRDGSRSYGVGGGSTAPVVGTFVFRPGGVEDVPNRVFTTWPSLMIGLDAVDGPRVLVLDESLGTLTAPAGGPYDMTDVEWRGAPESAYDSTDITIADGASFTNLFHISHRIFIWSAATSSPMTLTNGDMVWIDDYCDISIAGGAAPFFDCSGIGSGHYVKFSVTNSSLGWWTANPVIGGSPTGSTVSMVLDSGSAIYQGTMAGDSGSTLSVQHLSASTLIQTQAAWLGVQDYVGRRDLAVDTGFANLTDSTVSKVDGTRTLSVTPVGDNFQFYVNGVGYTKTSAEDVIWTDVEGTHYIYYTDAGVLTSSTSFPVHAVTPRAIVAILYWDATNNAAIYAALEERHGHGGGITPTMHEAQHLAIGALYESGLQPGNMVTNGNGDVNTHAQMSVTDGAIWDEDIRTAILDSVQDLSPILNAPVWYMDGT
ncbi:hypothetical protein DRQ25_05135, partial [Candidatus Fermentibacteria bacterium]